MSELNAHLANAVIEGDIDVVQKLAKQALAGGTTAQDILDNALMPGMNVVGQRFRDGDMFIPEVLLSARTMQATMQILRPLLAETGAVGIGTVVIGTVEGDIHTIGKDLVAAMMEGAGFKVIDLGSDVKSQRFVEAVREYKPDIVAISAMLTTTMPKFAEIVNALKKAGIRDMVKIMAGGAPVSREFVVKIGGDGYGSNATAAVDGAKALIGR